MKKLLLITLLLSACASNTAPVMPKWPVAPAELQSPVPDLTPLTPEQRNLSDLIENSNENYAQYYILKEKYESWQNWYSTQQKIWEGLQ
jgi:hypothetical protein